MQMAVSARLVVVVGAQSFFPSAGEVWVERGGGEEEGEGGAGHWIDRRYGNKEKRRSRT